MVYITLKQHDRTKNYELSDASDPLAVKCLVYLLLPPTQVW